MSEKSQVSFEALVGKVTYSVWVDMLRVLVPQGRTHRLAVVVAGMIQCVWRKVSDKYDNDPPDEDELAVALLNVDEVFDPDDFDETLWQAVVKLFADAGVEHARQSAKGVGYSIAEVALAEFLHWEDMPWEH